MTDDALPCAQDDVISQLEEGAWFSHGGRYDNTQSPKQTKLRRRNSHTCCIL